MQEHTVSDCAGLVTYWRLPKVELPYEVLQTVWSEAGLDPVLLPKPTRPAKALHRAVTEYKAPRRLPRPLKRGGSWALVEETTVGDDGLEHSITATAKLEVGADKAKTLVTTGNGLSEKIRSSYERQLEFINQNDLVDLLINVLRACRSVSLRQAGGVYFIPSESEALWEKASSVLEGIAKGAVVYRLRLNIEPGTVAAVFDAMVAEAEAEVAGVFAELERGEQLGDDEKPLGLRAIHSRMASAEKLRAKVAAYESLLGKSMSSVCDSLEVLTASLTEAEVRASVVAEASADASQA